MANVCDENLVLVPCEYPWNDQVVGAGDQGDELYARRLRLRRVKP